MNGPQPPGTANPATRPGRTLRLLDLVALIVGYGLAALLVRTFWRTPPEETPLAVTLVLGLVYTWLGLAMSGPLILLLDRRAAPRDHAPVRLRVRDRVPPGAGPTVDPRSPAGAEAPARYTRAELAWLSIGAYWIGMTFLVVPARLHDSALALVAVLQVVAALALWAIVPSPAAPAAGSSWTHRTAVGLLLTWPLAWAGMILLCRTVL